MMRLLDNLQYKAAINRHIHHDAYKVLAVLIPDSVQQLPALFKIPPPVYGPLRKTDSWYNHLLYSSA